MEHKVPTAGHGEIHALRQEGSGQLFAYTDELAARPDMKPYIGPALSSQPADSVQSQATILANASESQRKVQQLLAEAQGHLDEANHRSHIERQSFEAGLHPLQDENAALKARIAELETAGAVGGTFVTDHQGAVTPEPQVAPVVAAPSFTLPEGVSNVEVVAHTDTPVTPQPETEPVAALVPPVLVAPQAPSVLTAAADALGQLN